MPATTFQTITQANDHFIAMDNVQVPQTMIGLQLTAFKQPYRFSTDIPVPRITRDNEVLIKVAVAGYCHSEQLVQNGEFVGSLMNGEELPVIPSHECAGTVVAVGQKVTNVKIGDRVGTLAYKNHCGKCDDCKNNLKLYCDERRFAGVSVDGAAAEYMLAECDWTVPLPASVSFEMAAPLMCAGSTIYRGLKTANLRSKQTVAIIGIGALGHLGIQFAKCLGLRVVAIDSRQAPLDLARSLKYAPDYTIDATMGVEHAIKELGGVKVDATIVSTDAMAAFSYGLTLTRKHGIFVVIGLPHSPIPIHYHHLVLRDITVKGCTLGDRDATQEMVQLVADKGIEVKLRVYGLEDIESLLKDYGTEDRIGKLVLRVSGDK